LQKLLSGVQAIDGVTGASGQAGAIDFRGVQRAGSHRQDSRVKEGFCLRRVGANEKAVSTENRGQVYQSVKIELSCRRKVPK